MAMLIAGWEGHYTQFSALVPALHRAGWTVVTVDPPGHGTAEGRYSNPALFARALHVAATELGTPDVLIGHSMGGIAAMLAVHQGLNARQLVTVATPDAVAGPIDRFAGRCEGRECLRGGAGSLGLGGGAGSLGLGGGAPEAR